jgi:hypothetical protein
MSTAHLGAETDRSSTESSFFLPVSRSSNDTGAIPHTLIIWREASIR